MASIETLLVSTYQQDSVFGIQQIAARLPSRTLALIEAGMETYQRIATIAEMREQLYGSLRNSWQVGPDCSRDSMLCRLNVCGCSYGDMVRYMGLGLTLNQLNSQFEAIAKECLDLRTVYTYVLWPGVISLLKDSSYRQHFGNTLLLLGEISPEQRELMDLPGFFRASGCASHIVLHFGSDDNQSTVQLLIAEEPRLSGLD